MSVFTEYNLSMILTFMIKIIKLMSHAEFYIKRIIITLLTNHQKMLLACIFVTRKYLDCCKSHKPTCTWLLCLPGTEKHPTPQLSSCCCGCWCCCCAALLLSVLLSTLPAAGDEEEEVVAVIVRLLPVSVIWNCSTLKTTALTNHSSVFRPSSPTLTNQQPV